MSAVRVKVKRLQPASRTVAVDGTSTKSINGFSVVVPDSRAFVSERAALDELLLKVRRVFNVKESVLVSLCDYDTGASIVNVDELFDTQQLVLIEEVLEEMSDEKSGDDEEIDDVQESVVDDDDDDEDEDNEVDANLVSFCMFPDSLKTQQQQCRSRELVERACAAGEFTVVLASDNSAVLKSSTIWLRVLHSAALPCDVFSSLRCRFEIMCSQTWFVALCHGGKFAAAIVERGAIGEFHRRLCKYVTRAKQGKRQTSYDRGARGGGGHSSAGSQMRRSQEKQLNEDIARIITSWSSPIQHCDVLFVFAPGHNRASLFFKGSPLRIDDVRLRPIPISTRCSTIFEVKRVVRKLGTVHILENKS